jgi:hypothetical protein
LDFLKHKRKRRSNKVPIPEKNNETILDFDNFIQEFESKEELDNFTRVQEILVKKIEENVKNIKIQKNLKNEKKEDPIFFTQVCIPIEPIEHAEEEIQIKIETLPEEKRISRIRKPRQIKPSKITKMIKPVKLIRNRNKKDKEPLSLPVNKLKKTRAYNKKIKRKSNLKRKTNVFDIDNFVIQNNAVRIHQRHQRLDIQIPVYKEVYYDDEEEEDCDINEDIEEVIFIFI